MPDCNDMNRRDFVTTAATVTAAIFCAGALTPRAKADDAPATQPAAGISVGAKSDYPKDGITITYEKAHHILIVRDTGKIYALTSRCTHKGCDIKVAPTADHFVCPCHHAQFSNAGKVLHGPAKISLVRYAISADTQGNLTVDTTQMFTDQHWNDPASFVTVDAGA